MRDRLRTVECPKEIIDQIGGWSSSDVGESYGEGVPLLESIGLAPENDDRLILQIFSSS